MLKISPLGDRVLVQANKKEEVVSGGIILPGADKMKKEMGIVIIVGPGRYDDHGNLIPMPVSIGDCVMWEKYSAKDIKASDEEDLYVIKADDIIAIVNE